MGSMESTHCYTCNKSKAPLACGICQNNLCKSCAQFVEEGHFSYMAKVPADLSHTIYCAPCYDAKVADEMVRYNETMEKARNINVFEKGQGKETRLIKRKEQPVRVGACPDRQEVLLRLAFQAAELGYNGILDVDIRSEKVFDNSYQSTRYSGTGIPANFKGRD